MDEEQVRTIIEAYLNENLPTLIQDYLDEKEYITDETCQGYIEQSATRFVTPSQDSINEMVYAYNQTDDGVNQIQNICGDYITENFELE